MFEPRSSKHWCTQTHTHLQTLAPPRLEESLLKVLHWYTQTHTHLQTLAPPRLEESLLKVLAVGQQGLDFSLTHHHCGMIAQASRLGRRVYYSLRCLFETCCLNASLCPLHFHLHIYPQNLLQNWHSARPRPRSLKSRSLASIFYLLPKFFTARPRARE